MKPTHRDYKIVKIALQKIYDLQAKHKCQSVEELIAIRESLDEKVQSTATIGEDLIKLAKEREVLNAELLELAQNISHKRKNTIPSLKEELESLLGVLGMPNARFNIDLLPSERMLLNGKDELVFEFSANKGSNFGSLKKVASGGELSRIMLSIKAILSRFTTTNHYF